MKAAGHRRNFGNNDYDSKNKNSMDESSSVASDFSDFDDTEIRKGTKRSNKSKVITNIIPSFLDEILREIDETNGIIDNTNIKAENSVGDDNGSVQINQNIIISTTSSETKNGNIQDNQNTSQTTSISELKESISEFSNNSNDGFITTPKFDNTPKKISIATSPFKPRPKNQEQQNVVILYPVDPSVIQQRKQHENDLLQRAKQQQQQEQNMQKNMQNQNQQNKQKSIQQLKLKKDHQLKVKDNLHQEKILNQQQKSINEETTKDINSDERDSKKVKQTNFSSSNNNNSREKPKNVISPNNKKESKAVYLPPVYDKKLNSFFDIVSSESDEPFTRDHIFFETSQAEIRDVFVFDSHEEGGRLYLFCKYVADPTQYGTICICVTSPSLFLQFLPSLDISDESVEKEIDEIAKLCDGEIISKKWLNKRTINSSLDQKFLEVELSTRFNIANVPIKGKTYEAVYGSTLSSSDHFIIRNNLKGAKWINVRCSQAPHQQTSIPMFITPSPFDIEVVKGPIQKPSMNLCIFSIFKRNNMVFMVSMRILYQCNYETLDNYKGLHAARKSIITFIYAPEVLKTPNKNDKTAMYCSTEAELLQNFAERIEQFDIDILCSYDLINHDLPFIIGRMKANNIKQWSKLGRHIRTVYPKKESSLSLITSGRMLLDLKSAFNNLLQIESDSFSSLVQTELLIDRPNLNLDTGSFCFTDQKQMQELINLNRKDTQMIKKILDNKNIISLAEHISRITGCQWSQIMSEPPSLIIEFLIIIYLQKKNYIIPDKKQKFEKYMFSPFKINSGFYINPTALISCDFLTPKIIQKKNLCFTTIGHLSSQKTSSILPTIISELLNTLKVLDQKETEIEPSQASLFTKNIYKESLYIILNLIKPYFEYGSQRFPIISLGKAVDNEIQKIINSFGENVLCVSGKNDYDSILIEYMEEDDQNGLDGIDKLILHANKEYKHLEFKVVEKYSRLLISENAYRQIPFCDSIPFLGISKEGDKIPHNYDFYRYDWCNATKILIDNAIDIVMSSVDIENDIVTLVKDFANTNQLKPSDFAITTFPPNAQIVSQNKKIIESQRKNVYKTNKVINLNRNKSVLRHIVDDSDADDEQNQPPRRKFLSSSLDDDFDDIETEVDDLVTDKDYYINENHDLLNLNAQLIEIMRKYEEKGIFVNIEGKISYIRCLNNVIKSVKEVKSIEDEIDIEWYKKYQFFDALKLSMKPFVNIISESQIIEAFFGSTGGYDYYDISTDVNNIKLFFHCFHCNHKNVFSGISEDCFECQNCRIRFNWKFLANSLTFSISKLVEKWSKNILKCNNYLCKQKREQIQMFDLYSHIDPCNPKKKCKGKFTFEWSPKDIYENILSLEDLFDTLDNSKKQNDSELINDINELSAYMKNCIQRLKRMHSFTSVRLSDLLSTQASDTQIINDVCSFLDDDNE